MYCRFCGKEIPSNSIFCPNCGKSQSEDSSKVESSISLLLKKHRNVIILYIIWCLIHVGLLISAPSEETFHNLRYSKTDAFYPYDTSLSKVLQGEVFHCNPLKYVDAYDSSELFFYIIILPIIIWGIEKLGRKVAFCCRTKGSVITNGQNGKNLGRRLLFVSIGVIGLFLLGSIGFAIHSFKEYRTEQTSPIDTDSIAEIEDSIIEEEESDGEYSQRIEQGSPIDTDSIEEIVDSNMEDCIINNDNYVILTTGDTPYSDYYGNNMNCRRTECSGVKVTAPETSDVVVIVKKRNERGKVAGHAYINAGDTYKIDLPDGTYQTFFYYGDGWNANKDMGNGIKGGFVRDEVFSKDDPQDIYSAVLSYVLQLRRDGNFHAESSNRSEVF